MAELEGAKDFKLYNDLLNGTAQDGATSQGSDAATYHRNPNGTVLITDKVNEPFESQNTLLARREDGGILAITTISAAGSRSEERSNFAPDGKLQNSNTKFSGGPEYSTETNTTYSDGIKVRESETTDRVLKSPMSGDSATTTPREHTDKDEYFDKDGKVTFRRLEDYTTQPDGTYVAQRTTEDRQDNGTYKSHRQEYKSTADGVKTETTDDVIKNDKGETISGVRTIETGGTTTREEFHNGYWKLPNGANAPGQDNPDQAAAWPRSTPLSAYGGWSVRDGTLGSQVSLDRTDGPTLRATFAAVNLADRAAAQTPPAPAQQPIVRQAPVIKPA